MKVESTVSDGPIPEIELHARPAEPRTPVAGLVMAPPLGFFSDGRYLPDYTQQFSAPTGGSVDCIRWPPLGRDASDRILANLDRIDAKLEELRRRPEETDDEYHVRARRVLTSPLNE